MVLKALICSFMLQLQPDAVGMRLSRLTGVCGMPLTERAVRISRAGGAASRPHPGPGPYRDGPVISRRLRRPAQRRRWSTFSTARRPTPTPFSNWCPCCSGQSAELALHGRSVGFTVARAAALLRWAKKRRER
jgi:hypothetical protein